MELLKFNFYHILFLIFCAIILITFPILSLDFGITWDEWTHNHYSILVTKFYLSMFKDQSCLHFSDLYLYGGLVDVLGLLLYRITGWFGEYESRHIVISIFGAIAVIYTGLSAKLIGGWRAGLIAMILITVSPHFLGHSMNNPKDIPFATVYIAVIYYLLKFFKDYPNPGRKTIVLLTLFISLSINIRIGGLLLIMYFIFFTLLITFYCKFHLKYYLPLKRVIITGIVVIVMGYLGGMLFWPYGLINPFLNPIKTLLMVSNYTAINQPNLFDGKIISSLHLPWYYLIRLIFITNPLVVLTGFLLFLIFGIRIIHSFNKFFLFIILFSVFFPLLYTILMKSVLHDGWRHFLFIYPLIVVVSAITWDHFFNMNNYFYKIICSIIFTCLLIEPLLWNIKNYPHQNVYFNPIVGGTNGAYTSYETDYWGNSLRYGAEWFGKNYGSRIGDSIIVYTNANTECSFYYLKKYGNFKMVREENTDWKFGILLIRGNIKSDSLICWPPKETIFHITADDVTLCAIVKRKITSKY